MACNKDEIREALSYVEAHFVIIVWLIIARNSLQYLVWGSDFRPLSGFSSFL